MRFIFSAVITLGIVLGCASPRPLPTASGFPEVTIAAPKTTVAEALVDRGVTNQWSVKKSDSFQIVLARRDTSTKAVLLLGSGRDPYPEVRLTLTLVERDGETRVVARMAWASNPDSPHESVVEIGAGRPIYIDVQKSLSEVKAQLEGHSAIVNGSAIKQ
nr:hypothetical protein [uncultured Holophaga sp.]